jgi:hypothetical protein
MELVLRAMMGGSWTPGVNVLRAQEMGVRGVKCRPKEVGETVLTARMDTR